MNVKERNQRARRQSQRRPGKKPKGIVGYLPWQGVGRQFQAEHPLVFRGRKGRAV